MSEITDFNLLDAQKEAKEAFSDPQKLFNILNTCYARFDKGWISIHELDEMRDLIYPMLERLERLKAKVNSPSK